MAGDAGSGPSRVPGGAPPACAHCGLPVLVSGRRGTHGDGGPSFCCLGCRLAYAVAPGEGGQQAFLEARLLFSAFLAMGVMTFTLVLYGESAYAGGEDAATPLVRRVGQIGVALFALPVLGLLGIPIIRGAWRDLRQGLVRMDGLIALGTFAAYGLSLHHTILGAGAVYYETATMVLVLVMFGRRLEAHARLQGRDAARALADNLPRAAHRIGGDGTASDADPSALVPGDLVAIRPGEHIPADVLVLEGTSEVATAHLTGESAAATVLPGDEIAAGATNGLGALVARVLRPWKDAGLGQILRLLDAPLPMTRVMRSIDRLAGFLAGVSIVIAAAGGIRSGLLSGVGEGIRTALSVLLVACPCALGLATPLAYRAIRAALAKRGVLVNDPCALEVACTVDTVVLDKTGTITESESPLQKSGATGREPFFRLEDLVSHSGHVLGRRVARRSAPPAGLRVHPGMGVEARIQGIVRRAGRPEWLDAAGIEWPGDLAADRAELEARGSTMVAYAEGDHALALASAEQSLRSGALDAVGAMRARGLDLEILSGDRHGAVERIAGALGIPARGAMSPEDKVLRIAALKAGGRRVMMAGDGVNDAPALRGADVSVAMGSGAAVARSQAQVEVIGDDLRTLALFLDGARVLRRVVRGNLFWTLLYNGVALAFAAAGRLHPVIAAAAMIGSSLAVSVRSYRLLGFGAPEPAPAAAEAGPESRPAEGVDPQRSRAAPVSAGAGNPA